MVCRNICESFPRLIKGPGYYYWEESFVRNVEFLYILKRFFVNVARICFATVLWTKMLDLESWKYIQKINLLVGI